MATTYDNEEISPDSIGERIKAIGPPDTATAVQPAAEEGAAPAVSPSAGAATAAPPPTPPAQPAATEEWWNGEGVTHTMLRTATSAQVEQMYRNAQKKIREQGEENARLRALAATAPAAPSPAAAAPSAARFDDPRKLEYEAAYFSGDMTRAIEIQREWAREEATAVLAQEREQQTAQQRANATTSAARTSMAAIATDYHIEDADFLEYRFLNKVLPEMNRYATENVFRDYGGESGDPAQVAQAEEARRAFMAEPQRWRDVYEALFGQPPLATPAATITAPAVPQRATPPHSTAMAPSAPPTRMTRQPSLDATLDRRLTLLSDGILDEAQSAQFKQRVASRAAK